MKEKELTGYPHIDRPWLKWYDETKMNKPLPNRTLYQEMIHNVSNNLDNPALTYNGEEVTYARFINNVENASKILTAIGVCEDDRILYLMANLPETAYTLYAGNMIGAVSDYIDPRPDSIDFKVSAKKVLDIVKREKIKKIVSLDQCYLAMLKPIENELKEYGIENILLVSPSDSMSTKGKINYIDEYIKFNGISAGIKKLKYLKVISEKLSEAVKTSPIDIIFYSDLSKNVSTVNSKMVDYVPNRLSVITHSSGTSGFPKTIPLTNENIISYGFQLLRSNVDAKFGDSCLQILPYFSAYGLGLANIGYSHGINMIQIPEFTPKDLGKLIKKYKPTILMGTPNWYLSLPKDKSMKNTDLSFIKIIGYGGDSMNPIDEQNVNLFLQSHNCNVKVTKGHGMSELAGGSSYATGEYNMPGSMGIPMIDTIYGVVDPITKEPIKFKEDEEKIVGEFIVSSSASVSPTIDGREVVKHKIYDGNDYIFTNDIGAMDKNGVLYFLSRNDRTFTRYDGFKVKPYEIEKEIKKVPGVKDCIITSYEDSEKFGKMIKADIVLMENGILSNQNDIDVVNYIINSAFVSNPRVSSRQIPSKVRIRESLPFTKNSKIDYNALQSENLDDYELNIIFDETSISVDNIRIEKNKTKTLSKNLI